MSVDRTDEVHRVIAEPPKDRLENGHELSGRHVEALTQFNIRICDISGTPWRIPPGLEPTPLESFDLTRPFREIYRHQQGLPWLLSQRFDPGGEKQVPDGPRERFEDLLSVEVVLFALPIPVRQVVTAVIVDLVQPAISQGTGGPVSELCDAMLGDLIRLEGLTIAEIVDSMAEASGARRVDDPQADVEAGVAAQPHLEEEHHLLVFAGPVNPTNQGCPGEPMPADLDDQARALIYGVHWPFQSEFATITRPPDLNTQPDDTRRPGRYAAISHYASVLYGQSGEVNASALLIAAQTVGTAARFQRIWRRASQQVAEFQRDKQAKTGKQTRESLAPLADEMGDLELDLTFNVQTAADLGLGSTTAFVDSFQQALHVAMKFKTRAETVATMFERVNSSIQSELTAIVSREREQEEARHQRDERAEQQRREREEADRLRGAAIIGALSFFLAPITVIFGYFGINTADIGKDDHMFDWRFWPVYAVALFLMLLAVVWAFVNLRVIRRRKPKTPASSPPDEITAVMMMATRRRRKRSSAEEIPLNPSS